MGHFLVYPAEVRQAMRMLAEDPCVLFIGQNVLFGGAIAIHESLEGIAPWRIIEFPVAEELQLGLSLGLSLEGFIPVSIFPRCDFLLRAADQLVNHLDKMEQMSHGEFLPKVIVRTGVGTRHPLDPGPQHSQDHTEALRLLCPHISVVKLDRAEDIVPAYRAALASPRSTILVEFGEKMREHDHA